MGEYATEMMMRRGVLLQGALRAASVWGCALFRVLERG